MLRGVERLGLGLLRFVTLLEGELIGSILLRNLLDVWLRRLNGR